MWALVALGACPQVAKDDFERLAPNSLGGATVGAAGTSGGATIASGGCAVVGAGGGCDVGGGGVASSAGDPAMTPDASIFFAPDEPGGCSAGGVRGPNGDCYLAIPVQTSWSEARVNCQVLGAGWDLAIVRSAEENDFIVSMTGYEVWLGATDEDDEGEWVWVLDDAPFFDVDTADAAVAFTRWNSGEPNNQDNSDCLRVLTTGLWADWDCDGSKGRMCQQTAR